LCTALALEALDKAAKLGSLTAHKRLGDLYSAGEDVTADYLLARDHYEKAASHGNIGAMIRLAEMQARGQGTHQDLAAAQARLAAIARTGSSEALLALGDLYGGAQVVPFDPASVLKYYKDAAALGDVMSLLRLAQGYSEGRFGKRDVKEAERLFTMALQTGSPNALLALGRFEASAPSAKKALRGIGRLRHAVEENVAGAPVVLADALFYGRKSVQDSTDALEILQNAAKERDAAATVALIAAYRDGKRDGRTLLVKKDTSKARALLDAAQDLLPVPAKTVQMFLLDASDAPERAFEGLADRLGALQQPERRQIVRALPKTNANLFIYLAKAHLQNGGPINGRLDRQVLAAIVKKCRALLPARQCRRGPFHARVVETIVQTF
jgi:TPR repeat protein